MKVVAKTDGGYLVEATLGELVMVAGESALSKAPFVKELPGSSYGRDWTIPIGSIVEVSTRFLLLEKLEQGRDGVLRAAATLRALADLAEKSIPEGLILPPPAFAEVEENPVG